MNPQASDLFENQHDRFIEEQLFAIHSERQFEINPSGFVTIQVRNPVAGQRMRI